VFVGQYYLKLVSEICHVGWVTSLVSGDADSLHLRLNTPTARPDMLLIMTASPTYLAVT